MMDPILWPRSPHTAVKHQILEGYLGAWFAKLAWTGRVLFIDGFAGPGRYSGGETGSPIIALKLAVSHRAFAAGERYSSCERHLVFVEKDPDHFSHLESEVREIVRPTNVVVSLENMDFEQSLSRILDRFDSYPRFPPVFAMIEATMPSLEKRVTM